MELLLFTLFALIAVGCAINMVMQSHPISSALSLVGVMASLAVLYLLLGGEFIAMVQIIVYAGAVMVLFIFVIMLLNAGEEERTQGSQVAMILGVPGVLTTGLLIAWTLLHRSEAGSAPLGALPGSPKTIGNLLFHDFLLPFEVTSVLVLIAIMGAVVLAQRAETPNLPPGKEI